MSVRNVQGTDSEVPTSVLSSLVRLATACAQLCGRSVVEETPDIVLAIKLVEETLVAKVGIDNIVKIASKFISSARPLVGFPMSRFIYISAQGFGISPCLITICTDSLSTIIL